MFFLHSRQSLNPDRQIQVRRPTNNLLSHYKALGWTGLSGADAKKKALDLKFMRHYQQKHSMRLGCKANYLQKHFRDPTMHVG